DQGPAAAPSRHQGHARQVLAGAVARRRGGELGLALMLPDLLSCHEWGCPQAWSLAGAGTQADLVVAHMIGDAVVHYGRHWQGHERKRGWAYCRMGLVTRRYDEFYTHVEQGTLKALQSASVPEQAAVLPGLRSGRSRRRRPRLSSRPPGLQPGLPRRCTAAQARHLSGSNPASTRRLPFRPGAMAAAHSAGRNARTSQSLATSTAGRSST